MIILYKLYPLSPAEYIYSWSMEGVHGNYVSVGEPYVLFEKRFENEKYLDLFAGEWRVAKASSNQHNTVAYFFQDKVEALIISPNSSRITIDEIINDYTSNTEFGKKFHPNRSDAYVNPTTGDLLMKVQNDSIMIGSTWGIDYLMWNGGTIYNQR